MKSRYPSATPLREIMRQILVNRQSPGQLNDLRALLNAMALAFLKRKVARGEISPAILARPLEVLARASVAGVIGAGDTPTPLQAFLAGGEINAMSDEELLVLIRRLTFARVNATLSRTCRELDPSLCAIIDSMNSCVTALGMFTQSERFGIPLLTPVLCTPLLHRPIPDRETLLEFLRRPSVRADRIPETMEALSLYLRTQSAHARSVPLDTLAMAFRECSTPFTGRGEVR
jgi:hypothetical protein